MYVPVMILALMLAFMTEKHLTTIRLLMARHYSSDTVDEIMNNTEILMQFLMDSSKTRVSDILGDHSETECRLNLARFACKVYMYVPVMILALMLAFMTARVLLGTVCQIGCEFLVGLFLQCEVL
jgi:hypothetical protein